MKRMLPYRKPETLNHVALIIQRRSRLLLASDFGHHISDQYGSDANSAIICGDLPGAMRELGASHAWIASGAHGDTFLDYSTGGTVIERMYDIDITVGDYGFDPVRWIEVKDEQSLERVIRDHMGCAILLEMNARMRGGVWTKPPISVSEHSYRSMRVVDLCGDVAAVEPIDGGETEYATALNHVRVGDTVVCRMRPVTGMGCDSILVCSF